MLTSMRAKLAAISPSFIVTDVDRSIAFYCDKLGFEIRFREADAPWFAVIGREGAQLFIKSEGGITPVPNNTRHRHLRLDAFVYTADPAGLAAEFTAQGVTFSSPMQGTTDGLTGFELADPDGYILFFGCPTPEVKPTT
jgi:catechol 2,3-dioxygenase-like lactoylglutathione lyase family enzyme